ncbi:MAG: hypothetical protein CMH22_05650 [Methylophaga sp.]|nr:hypothetical protein [Methylophaga sp.]|tara:strand:+ start:101353 stop:101547 length:195 start_codon:yes stop_codon:yes gene_type:complete
MEKWNKLNEEEKHELYNILFDYGYVTPNTLINYGDWESLSSRLKNKVKIGFELQEYEKSPFMFV